MNYLKYLRIVATVLLFNYYSCGEDPQENLKTYDKIRKNIILSYEKKHDIFFKLKSCFFFKHIKYIEFKNNKIAIIEYQANEGIGKGELQKLENKDFASPDLKSVLDLDRLSVKDIEQLKDNLATINADNLWVIDNYDAIRGKYTKELDLRYTTSMNGLLFFYRIFQEPLNLLPDNSYNVITNNGTTGGMLGESVVWYYK